MNFHRKGTEGMFGDTLLTRVSRKPPHWMLERSDSSGQPLSGVLEKQPRGQRGWNILLEGGGVYRFTTKREALEWFERLERLEAAPIKEGAVL